MTALQLNESSIPDLTGQTAIVTGGSTGIGHATVRLLCQKGAKVHVLDIKPYTHAISEQVDFHRCDVSNWQDLSGVFLSIRQVDMAFINAGVSESTSFLDDLEPSPDQGGGGEAQFLEPTSPVLHVNLRASLNCIKLAVHQMKRQGRKGGRIVVTASSTAYMPERSLPLYSAMKLALIGLVRSLKHTLPKYNITINAVAPAATSTPLIDSGFLQIIQAAGLPYSSPEFVALALVFSATATQSGPVERYGGGGGGGSKDGVVATDATAADTTAEERWNGRVIVTLGDMYTEIEESLVKLRPTWFGERNAELTIKQQATTMKIDGM